MIRIQNQIQKDPQAGSGSGSEMTLQSGSVPKSIVSDPQHCQKELPPPSPPKNAHIFSGFLTTGTAEIPGNAGMMDQVMALRWIQENIRFLAFHKKDKSIRFFTPFPGFLGGDIKI